MVSLEEEDGGPYKSVSEGHKRSTADFNSRWLMLRDESWLCSGVFPAFSPVFPPLTGTPWIACEELPPLLLQLSTIGGNIPGSA